MSVYVQPEFSIARGVQHVCSVCDAPHDINVVIDRTRWICGRCAKRIGECAHVMARRLAERASRDIDNAVQFLIGSVQVFLVPAHATASGVARWVTFDGSDSWSFDTRGEAMAKARELTSGDDR